MKQIWTFYSNQNLNPDKLIGDQKGTNFKKYVVFVYGKKVNMTDMWFNPGAASPVFNSVFWHTSECFNALLNSLNYS